MKQKSRKLIAVFLSLLMVFSVFTTVPFTVAAEDDTKTLNTYSTVESTLAPGVTQTINQAYRSDGKYVKYYTAVADLSNTNVGLHATYGGAQSTVPGVTKMTQQIADMTALHTNPDDAENYIEHYAIVAGVNGDGYNVGTGAPSGVHIMNGVAGFGVSKAGNSPWFAWFADGTLACGRNNTDWDTAVAEHGAAQEAIGGFQLLMKDGNVIDPGTSTTQGGSTYWRAGFDYPCSFVGVTNEGKLILINCDGNNMGGSAGFDYDYTINLAQELGLKDLLCLDGGGSATYLSRPEGESNIKITSQPSDGSERAVANGLVLYSTAAPSNVFERAVLTVDNAYHTPYSQISVNTKGVSPAGTPVEIPFDVQWSLSDASFGTISDGVFTSNGKVGTVGLQMIYQDKIVGSVEVNIVNPTSMSFEQETMVIPFGKTSPIKIVAEYTDGELEVTFPVSIKASDFSFSFSEENAGTLNGFDLTAPTSEGENAVILTATYNHAQMENFSIVVSYGKASEIVWDFENGDVSNWLGWSDAKSWVLENAPDSTLGLEVSGNSNNEINGQCPGDNDSYTFLATSRNGHVKNGNYALGFTLDETTYNEYGQWEYNILFNVEGQVVLRDVANGKNATTVGMWIYVPEDLAGSRYSADTAYFAMEGQLYCGSSAENVGDYRVRNFNFQDTGIAMSATTNADYTEVGKWVYMSADISAYDYVSVQNPQGAIYREPSFIRFYFKRLEPKKYTFYFDDITLDYSSAVEDRDAPVINNPKYVVVDNGVDFTNASSSNKVLFTANIADKVADNTSGLNYASAKIYVDGVALDNVTALGNVITSEEVTLTAGKHEVIFEIADNMGTITRNKEILTINGTNPIWIEGHNDSGALAEYDSIYYMDLKVADASAISKIETEICLNFANTWQLPYFTVADGFTLEYSYVELTNSVKLTITKDADCTLTGNQTLVCIPVRIWSWPTGKSITAQQYSTSGSRPIVPIDFEVEYGSVTYSNGNYTDYLGTFYDYFTTDTKIQDETYKWHLVHTVTDLTDKNATCTENGYSDRTYCDVCQSVVDWGTIVSASGHNYEITDDVLKCACGETLTGVWTDGKEYVDGVVLAGWVKDSYYSDGVKATGIQVIDGYYYDFGEDGVCKGQTKITGFFYDPAVSAYRYAIVGELQGGWVDDYHYIDPTTKVAVSGEYYYAARGITYVFDEMGKTEGTWQKTSAGIRYWFGKWYYTARNYEQRKMVEIDGQTYNFNVEGFVTTGIHPLYADWASNTRNEMQVWSFDEETGALIEMISTPGVVTVANGNLYLIEADGFIHTRNAHVAKLNGDIYYVHHSGKLQVNGEVAVTDANGKGILTAGTYYFGEDGKLFSGMKKGADGELYYYDGGKLCTRVYNSELVEIDGSIYLVKWSGKVAANEIRDITAENSNGLGAGLYEFAADGKGTNISTFTGVKKEKDVLYYYENGAIGSRIYNSELVEIDGSIYFVKWSGKVAANETRDITSSISNGLLPNGTYYFGEDGKLFNGVKKDTDGILYYYKDGKLGKGIYNSELAEINGEIYFVKWSGKVAANETRAITGSISNGLLPNGTYYFGEDGKLFTGVKKDTDGIIYYYKDGKLGNGIFNSELAEINGEIYLVKWSGKVAVNETRSISATKANGLIEPGEYSFGPDGKMIK